MVTQVQILDEVFSISHGAYTIGKGMNLFSFQLRLNSRAV